MCRNKAGCEGYDVFALLVFLSRYFIHPLLQFSTTDMHDHARMTKEQCRRVSALPD